MPRLTRHQLLRRLARPAGGKIVLLILDGVGDVRSLEQPRTPLEVADTPAFDGLARRSALGRIVPVAQGITPGSGPGHLALFGYDPLEPEHDIGRGVLEALGLGLTIDARTLAARGNFATVDQGGLLLDRRAGRIPTAESRRLVEKIRHRLGAEPSARLDVEVHAGEGYRFVLLVRSRDGAPLSAAIGDTDPQRTGKAPLELEAQDEAAADTVAALGPVLATMRSALEDEERANAFLLRGFSLPPSIAPFGELYRLRAGAFAGYPLYRGVASVCGMQVFEECGKQPEELFAALAGHWDGLDFFFVHVKQTDMAGEDGDFDHKVEVIERTDRALDALLELDPEVIAVTGDHSTPVPMKAHSWHPVPLLVAASGAFVDGSERFTETTAARGHLGTIAAADLMGLLLANAGRLAKYGA